MWYVVQVRTGDERKISERFQHEIKAEGEDVFVPMFERRKNVKGKWTKEIKPLFPGYIFFQTKILMTGSEYTPISSEEELFLHQLIGDDYIAQESIGVIEGDKVIVMRGPLHGLEGNIIKINRHKRMAIIKADFMGGPREIKVGLEIIDKKPATA